MKIIKSILSSIIFFSCSKKENVPEEKSIINTPIQLTKIDSISTVKDAEEIIHTFGEYYDEFKIYKSYNDDSSCKRIADSLGISKTFYKYDFDKNGLTDLLVTGRISDFSEVFVILNYPNDSMDIKPLLKEYSYECTFVSVNKEKGNIDLFYTPLYSFYEKNTPEIVRSNLVYKFGGVIEYNSSPTQHKIEKIELETGPCFGTCPIFTLELKEKGKSTFFAKAYNFGKHDFLEDYNEEGEGTFTTQLKQKNWKELTEILNYIDFPKLDDNYAISATDHATAHLTITYDNGKIKKIDDYGLRGTYGLILLYDKLFEIRDNQDWNKIE
ncbi:hypothetical protein KRX57_04815 [Weeksellaceae bacterium TAE3-ERU29]|nr:hypothetical protein [Weeksellaceae bacterium TAE3-ERU29]